MSPFAPSRANDEDGEVGKFWQSRFKAVRLLDEAAVLACSTYVDLNPIRAALAESLEDSEYTSIQRRIQSLADPASQAAEFLSPLTIDERHDPIGPCVSANRSRCSDKGFLPLAFADYVELLKWTIASRSKPDSANTAEVPAALNAVGIGGGWLEVVNNFGRLFYNVAGLPHAVDQRLTPASNRRQRMSRQARDALARTA